MIPRRLTPHRILWAKATGADGGWGDPTHEDPVEVRHVLTIDETEREHAAGASEDVSSARVHTNGDPIIREGDLVTIWPGDPRERTESVQRVEHYEHPRVPTVDVIHLT